MSSANIVMCGSSSSGKKFTIIFPFFADSCRKNLACAIPKLTIVWKFLEILPQVSASCAMIICQLNRESETDSLLFINDRPFSRVSMILKAVKRLSQAFRVFSLLKLRLNFLSLRLVRKLSDLRVLIRLFPAFSNARGGQGLSSIRVFEG